MIAVKAGLTQTSGCSGSRASATVKDSAVALSARSRRSWPTGTASRRRRPRRRRRRARRRQRCSSARRRRPRRSVCGCAVAQRQEDDEGVLVEHRRVDMRQRHHPQRLAARAQVAAPGGGDGLARDGLDAGDAGERVRGLVEQLGAVEVAQLGGVGPVVEADGQAAGRGPAARRRRWRGAPGAPPGRPSARPPVRRPGPARPGAALRRCPPAGADPARPPRPRQWRPPSTPPVARSAPAAPPGRDARRTL